MIFISTFRLQNCNSVYLIIWFDWQNKNLSFQNWKLVSRIADKISYNLVNKLFVQLFYRIKLSTRVTPSKEIIFFRIALFSLFFSIFTHVYFIGGISWRNLLLFLLPINRHKTMVVYNECNRSIYFNQKSLKHCPTSNLFSVIFTVFKTATIAKPYYNQIHWLH